MAIWHITTHFVVEDHIYNVVTWRGRVECSAVLLDVRGWTVAGWKEYSRGLALEQSEVK